MVRGKSDSKMLRVLNIKNFAVIDQATFDLGPGLNVLTGETGAGKTIVLNALGLILGGRITSEIIRHGEEEATVEALFESLPRVLQHRLREAGHGNEDELVIRRIVSRSGKNRIYLNGSLCPSSLLAEIGCQLIRIYGQHEHHSLMRPESHLAILDAYGGLEDRAEELKKRYLVFRTAWDHLEKANEKLERAKREEDLLRAQADEISRASLQIGEEEELQARKKILTHAEKLYQGCREEQEILYEGEDAVVGRLGRCLLRLRELASIDNTLNEPAELLSSSLAQLEEATSTLRHYTDRVEFDPQALEQLEDRLAEINRLKRKYNGSVEDILKIRARVEQDLADLDRGEEEMGALRKDLEEARRSAWEGAEALSNERRRIARRIKKDLEREVESLGMPRTQFEIRFLSIEEKQDEPPFLIRGRKITEEGIDQVEFYFSPNPGEPVKPLAKFASGGELSRVMLAIKSLVLTRGEIPTLLFDEVDAGIGGSVAEMVGNKLKRVADSHQVICVTHLPQIAALANSHYVVEKEIAKGRTFAKVKRLGDRERVSEVARMLGGIKVTDQAKRHAAEMIKIHQTGSTD
ncbi:MAG: DNA repair protein RecN [Deltaproteobacteria bacterium]|nr:DNA repair protein RecN [Deltaproteobacteria bacterium]